MTNISTPKAYLEGWSEFYKLKFKVTPSVLIPRPETELMVEEVLFCIKNIKNPKIIDLGTGSGCIAISIVKNNPSAQILAFDISLEALEIAQENIAKYNLETKIICQENDLLSGIKGTVDVLVANLPYVPTARILRLDSSVRDHEPRIALDGGPDGFDLYRRLFKQIRENAIQIKLIICEIDDTQQEIALWEAKQSFPKAFVEVKKDLNKKPRILVIRNI